MLAETVRTLETAVRGDRVTPGVRTTFQAVTLLLREERSRVRADETRSERQRTEQLKGLDNLAAVLVRIAVRDAGLLALLAEDAVVSAAARTRKLELLEEAGIEVSPEDALAPDPSAPTSGRRPERSDRSDRAESSGDSPAVRRPDAQPERQPDRQVVPQSVTSRQLSNPFLAPEISELRPAQARPRQLAGWELLGPLLTSFERANSTAPTSMALPAPTARFTPAGLELMPHQGQVVAAAAGGHRTFLLADEPGLGKTAQSLLAAEAAQAYPFLVIVPNVLKTNWAREAARWLPHRPTTVVHGDGDTVDGFADIVIVNYDVLDRHHGWLGDLGLRGMVIDEAHFIKNKTSQRSKYVLALADRVRFRTSRPLMMALTGTPLINDIDDFRAIWQFLGWIDDTQPVGDLMNSLEAAGLTPADPGFFTSARRCVIDQGIVRRRKVDVAADIPARRIADLHVELDGPTGRSVRAAERDLAQRMVAQYELATTARGAGGAVPGVDLDLARRIARSELKQAMAAQTGDNVFTMMRRIGRAKAELAADYAVQLARSAGKVVFFAKHIDVMDAAEATFAKHGVHFSSIRGDQTPGVRQKNIDAFVTDPEVAVAVCSLTAAGVGLNLQVASNVVLAELSWTDAEQTQAIDRSHRIGQTEPVTAWRIIAAQTLYARIAELIGGKAGLAARALDGAPEELATTGDIQVEALVALLVDALRA